MDSNILLMQKREKKRLCTALSSVCCMLLGSYIAVIAFYSILGNFTAVLSYFLTIPESAVPVLESIEGIAAYIVQLLLPALIFILARRKRLRSCFVINSGESGMNFGTALAFGALAFAFACSMSMMCSYFTAIFGLDRGAFDSPTPTTVIGFVIEFISVALLPPLLEEFVFRGVILSELLPYGKTFAIVTSAVFFASVHGSIEQIAYSFVYGLIFAFIAIKSRSLLMPIIIHFLNNAYSCTMDYIEVVLPPDIYSLINGAGYVLLIAIGLICAVWILGTNKIKFTGEENSGCILDTRKCFSAYLFPVMIIYFILTFIETIGGYILA